MDTVAQLNAGVRLLTAQVHNNDGSWDLCHTDCALLNVGKLSSWLSDIKTWMDDNPNDGTWLFLVYPLFHQNSLTDKSPAVVTVLIVNSDDASPADLDTEFRAANIASYGYVPNSTTTALSTWPTLSSLIAANTRLITFVASLTPSTNTVAPYLLDEFTFVFETPFSVTSPSNFTCAPDRPPTVQGQTTAAIQSGRLSLVNHFLDSVAGLGIQVPNTAAINVTNGPASSGTGSLGMEIESCSAAYGKAPNFLLVDYFDQGNATGTVDELNGITSVGRVTSAPAATKTTSSSTQTRIPGRVFWTAGGVLISLMVVL